jgi:hypothetical protein
MPSEQSPNPSDELSTEYRFDYRKAKPNRFASEESQLNVVVLDDDVAQVFKTPESVNRVLRALIETMPNSADGETA